MHRFNGIWSRIVIEGVMITPLRQIADERGKVMHMLRVDDEHYTQFGEIYFSCIYPGIVKAWKLHKKMTMNCVVPQGQVKFVLYDDRKDSHSRGEIQEFLMGPDHYFLLTVPPMIWTGFQCLGGQSAILANCASLPHTSNEYECRDMRDPSIPYEWKFQDDGLGL